MQIAHIAICYAGGARVALPARRGRLGHPELQVHDLSVRNSNTTKADLCHAGGDCVALQAGLGAPGRRRRLPTRGVTMLDVSCKAPQGAALRLGPQLEGGCLRNLHMEV